MTFTGNPSIRPTPDRIRETLFNWLQMDIPGARCLELYAGSGVLSLEALSRGASHVTLIDKDPQTVLQLKTICDQFTDDSEYTLVNDLADSWLSHNTEQFDLIFVDPPFGTNEFSKILKSIHDRNASCGYVYVETNAPLRDVIPTNYAIHRDSKAGAVHYGLINPI